MIEASALEEARTKTPELNAWIGSLVELRNQSDKKNGTKATEAALNRLSSLSKSQQVKDRGELAAELLARSYASDRISGTSKRMLSEIDGNLRPRDA